MNNLSNNRSYSAYVWIFSALVIFIYAFAGYVGFSTPGVEQIVSTLSNIEAKFIFISALISAFLEGVYFLGTFFPGSTLVLILVVISQSSGTESFLLTSLSVFIGWSLAGLANVVLSSKWKKVFIKPEKEKTHNEKDNLWITWFPAFRANHEVAQVLEGEHALKVLFLSTKAKFYITVAIAICAFILSYFVNINQVSNKEGFLSLIVIATITMVVGFLKLRNKKM